MRRDGEGVQLCKAQSLEKFARWLLLTRGVISVVAVFSVRTRSTEDEELVTVSGVSLGTVFAMRVRLTADSELIGVSRECLGAMVAVVNEQMVISSAYRTDQSAQSF